MTGANYDIVAFGMLDKSLTGNPNTTFWRSIWKRHARFAIESLSQPFNTSTAFGQESQILLNRVGDMVYFTYLHVVLPGIVACDTTSDACPGIIAGGQFPTVTDGGSACAPCAANDEAALLEYLPAGYSSMTEAQQRDALKTAKDQWRAEKYGAGTELDCCTEGNSDCPDVACADLAGQPWAHFVNDVGHFLVDKATLIIGGQQCDRLWGLFMFLWEELSGKAGRRLTELVGRRYTRGQLICDSREERHIYCPLPFWFTLASGNALPLASLAYHGVQINIDFASLSKLVVVSGPDVGVRNARTGLGLTANDLKADMEITYVYLDSKERDAFSTQHFEQLIVQTQHYFRSDNKQICRIPLSFNHPTLELIFAVRRGCQEKANGWSNLSGVDGRDPIESAELLLNTTSRFGKKPALYWRGIVPYQHHSNLPEAFCYVMSFALSPESSTDPSGSCNLSRIDNCELVLDMQSALANESYTVLVFSRSWNLLRFREGVAGAAYQ